MSGLKWESFREAESGKKGKGGKEKSPGQAISAPPGQGGRFAGEFRHWPPESSPAGTGGADRIRYASPILAPVGRGQRSAADGERSNDGTRCRASTPPLRFPFVRRGPAKQRTQPLSGIELKRPGVPLVFQVKASQGWDDTASGHVLARPPAAFPVGAARGGFGRTADLAARFAQLRRHPVC